MHGLRRSNGKIERLNRPLGYNLAANLTPRDWPRYEY